MRSDDFQMWVTRGRTPVVQHIYPDCKHFGGFAPPRAATLEETRTLLTCDECRRMAPKGSHAKQSAPDAGARSH